ncbi:hypothetical protein [Nonomuraea sp. NPDC049158]|uniref:hypothetical protein n=1 Tax=Nonomuraea sp. NPDC049158 TaxID=3155649 RepID=UPI0033C7D64E
MTADAVTSYHGPHAASQQPGAQVVTWLNPDPFAERVRVVRHTCECRARIYELCAAGGLVWVRVTDRLGRSTVVKETHRFRTREAEELWLKILLGQAR